MQPAELYLAGGALAFYLFDSALLLYGNELAYTCVRGAWRNVRSSEWLLFRRHVLVPNPLTPQAPLLRLQWSEVAAPLTVTALPTRSSMLATTLPESLLQALRPLRFGVLLLLLLIGVALPLVLFAYGQGLPLLWLFAAVYLLDIALAIWVWRRRSALRLSRRGCLALSFDLLACPPFAINLVRKITLQQPEPSEALRFAAATFRPAHYAELRACLAKRVGHELAALDAGSPRYQQLLDYHQMLTEQDACPPAN